MEDEKINIANNYLIPKQIKDNGLKNEEWNLEKDALKDIIQSYTKEAGVRNLEREISKLARKTVKNILTSESKKFEINSKNLSDYLGVKKFKYGELEIEDRVGIATGLAWTEFGGEILKGFSLAMILGVIFGTYSSIYIANPVLILLNVTQKTILKEDKD